MYINISSFEEKIAYFVSSESDFYGLSRVVGFAKAHPSNAYAFTTKSIIVIAICKIIYYVLQ